MTQLYTTLYTLASFTADRLKKETKGATAVEYGLMVGLIAVVIIGAVTLLGTNLKGMFSDIAGSLGAKTTTAPAAG